MRKLVRFPVRQSQQLSPRQSRDRITQAAFWLAALKNDEASFFRPVAYAQRAETFLHDRRRRRIWSPAVAQWPSYR
ncbi:hypothetical protein FVA77_09265 [Phyllobacterium endophyticum]|nr:hypothetical protein FVA77_09265 [Phyllobacterium endophyticum]